MARIVWNPWKVVTIAIAAAVTTAVVTGLVVANWNGNEPPQSAATVSQPAAAVSQAPVAPQRTRPSRPAARGGTADVVKDALIGGAVGAGVGAAGGAIAGGGKGAGKGAAIGGIVGATAGTLYGLHDK